MRYALALALLLTACHSVRTVYDENGNVVKEKEPGKETDIMSSFEERINSGFSLKKNEEGVPEAVSHRVSRYQKDLNSARGTEERYGTSRYSGGGESAFADRHYDGRREYGDRREFTGGRTSSYSKDLRPDFMNSSRGLAHENYSGSDSRSSLEGQAMTGTDVVYGTSGSSYHRETESGYFETRRDRTPAPPVRNYRDYYNKNIMNTRSILGRDNSDPDK